MEFGPYEVLELVATGSTGTVYRARHTELGRVVAIKELSPALRAVPGLLERFRGEAQMLASLDDPHVVEVYDYTEEDDRAWIAQEWVEGVSLNRILDTHGSLTPEQSLGALRGALMGLAHAHGRGLVHRDVSTGNVLADLAGTSRVVDFGLAAPVGSTGGMGTPAFASPEAARGDTVGTSGDVYSAAAVLYLLLTGRPLFTGSADEVLRQQAGTTAPALKGQGDELAGLVARCLDKDPSARPPDAAAMLVELEEAAERRYGAGWLGNAGLVSVVATVVALLPSGTAAEATVTESSGVMDTGEPPVPAPDALPPAAPAPTHRKRRRLRRTSPVVIAAVVVLVAAGTATAVTVATRSPAKKPVAAASPTPSPTPSPTASPSAPPSPTAAPLSALEAPHGAFAYVVTVLTTNGQGDPPGTTYRGTWTVLTACAAVPCTGTITSTQGARYTTTWDGTTLVARGNRPSPCVSDATGQAIPGGAGVYNEALVNTLTVSKRAADGTPLTLTGTATSTQTRVREFSNCRPGPNISTRSVTAELNP